MRSHWEAQTCSASIPRHRKSSLLVQCFLLHSVCAMTHLIAAHPLASRLLHRSKREWNHRWGSSFGVETPPPEPNWRPIRTPLPLPPGRAPQTVEPTMSSLRWDAAIARGMVPMRAPSTVGSTSSRAPSMRAVSISSSADRRRELLMERHEELRAQLALVEEMLQQGKPSTMMTSLSGMSGISAATARTARSDATARSQATQRSGRGGVGLAPVAEDGSRPASRQGTPQITLTSEELARAHRKNLAAARASQTGVPLTLDPADPDYKATAPFLSHTTNEMALPGPKLSGIVKF